MSERPARPARLPARPAALLLPALPSHASAGAVVRLALADSVGSLARHCTAIPSGNDPEDVHRARVAARTLRSHLRTFGPLLDPAWGAGLAEEIRSLGRVLGRVRDAEVLLGRLEANVAALGEEAEGPGGVLLAEVERSRDAARDRLTAALREPWFAALLDRLAEAAREPALTPTARRPAAAVLPGLVAARWGRLRRTMRRLDAASTDRELHRARILAKRCRYAAEAVVPAIGKPARAFARAVIDLQDALGAHQDSVVALAWLRSVAPLVPPRSAFVAGELASMERAAAATARAAWPAAWRRLDRKELTSWM